MSDVTPRNSRLSEREIHDLTIIAKHLYNSMSAAERSKLNGEDLAALFFLKGREYTLDQLGVFENDDLQ